MDTADVLVCDHCRGARATVRCAARVYCSRRCAEHAWLGVAAPRIGFILRLTTGEKGLTRPYDVDYRLATEYIDAQVYDLLKGTVQFAAKTLVNVIVGSATKATPIIVDWTKKEADTLKKDRFNMLKAQEVMRSGNPMPKQLVLITEKMRAATFVDDEAFDAFVAHFETAKTPDAFLDKINSMPQEVRKLVESDAFKLREVSQMISGGSRCLGSIVAIERDTTPLQRFVTFLLDEKTELRRKETQRTGLGATFKPYGSLSALYLVTMMNEGRAPIMPGAPDGTVVFDQFAIAHPRSELKSATCDKSPKIDLTTFTKLVALADLGK